MKMPAPFFIFVIIFSALFTFPVFGLTPPYTPQMLQQEADLVIEGQVRGTIQCKGKSAENQCYIRYNYQTEIQINKILKGNEKVEKTIPVVFYHNDYSLSKCVGDQGASLHEGDAGTFYLKKSDKGYYYPFHWSSVEIKTSGSKAWPKCK